MIGLAWVYPDTDKLKYNNLQYCNETKVQNGSSNLNRTKITKTAAT